MILTKSYTLSLIYATLFLEVFHLRVKHVPLDKQSKQKRKEYYATQRQDWGDINPVTRVTPNLKAYNRKKNGQWYCKYEPLSVLFFVQYFLKEIAASKIICSQRLYMNPCIEVAQCRQDNCSYRLISDGDRSR